MTDNAGYLSKEAARRYLKSLGLALSQRKFEELMGVYQVKTFEDPLDRRPKLVRKADVEVFLQARPKESPKEMSVA